MIDCLMIFILLLLFESKSYNDPDRVCINSSTMMEGIHHLPQPPWYFGNNNKIKVIFVHDPDIENYQRIFNSLPNRIP